MREEVPAPGAVAVVVEPGAKDEVGGDAEEDTGGRVVSMALEQNTVKKIKMPVGVLHDNHPREETPGIRVILLPSLVIITSIPRAPVQPQDIGIILQLEALKLQTAVLGFLPAAALLLVCIRTVFFRDETLQSRPVGVAREIYHSCRILLLPLVVVASILAAGKLDPHTLGLGVDCGQSRELRVHRAPAHMFEPDDREAEARAAVAVGWVSVYEATD